METEVTIICPQLITLKEDNLGSGIPYMPIIAAYLAAVLKRKYRLEVIDAFGENPFNAWIEDKYIIQGITAEQLIRKVAPSSKYCILYVSTIMANYILHRIIRLLKEKYPLIKIIMIENSQSVIGVSLKYIYKNYFYSGADYIVTGECEEKIPLLLDTLQGKNKSSMSLIPGIIDKYNDNLSDINYPAAIIADLDALPFPAWEFFPLDNYWKLGYAHGPMQNNYIAVMTSRGCPYNCSFCVVPSMNGGKWRFRSPDNIVKEFEYIIKNFNVFEFHLEDLNPTSNEKRIIDLCRLIIEKKLKITWKLASGSKIETIRIDTLKLMREAGCTYISFSPESGSSRVLKLMNKPFKHEYALKMTKEMNKIGISTQACFVLGFPGENCHDRNMTKDYVKKLTKAGLDEIALFIMTPIPGTKTFDQFSGYSDYSELTFAPTWRKDYRQLCRFRNSTYLLFLITKLFFHPFKVLRQLVNLLSKKFETKSEMNIYRLLMVKNLIKKTAKINQLQNSR
ncbi:MAG: radical SAM protein [Actinobacteria bacterium]|nr:radical SAM protein [Actinomycetota bacterium]